MSRRIGLVPASASPPTLDQTPPSLPLLARDRRTGTATPRGPPTRRELIQSEPPVAAVTQTDNTFRGLVERPLRLLGQLVRLESAPGPSPSSHGPRPKVCQSSSWVLLQWWALPSGPPRKPASQPHNDQENHRHAPVQPRGEHAVILRRELEVASLLVSKTAGPLALGTFSGLALFRPAEPDPTCYVGVRDRHFNRAERPSQRPSARERELRSILGSGRADQSLRHVRPATATHDTIERLGAGKLYPVKWNSFRSRSDAGAHP